MDNTKYHVFFIIGSNQSAIKAFSSSLCQNSTYFYQSAPGKAVVHANHIANEYHSSNDTIQLDYFVAGLKSIAYPTLSQYLQSHCKQEECLVLSDIAHTLCLPQWIEACEQNGINIRVLYLYQYDDIHTINNLSRLALYESFSRDIMRYALELSVVETYTSTVAKLLSKRLAINQQYCIEALEATNQVLPINPTIPPYDLGHLSNLLIHNSNSKWTHSILLDEIKEVLDASLQNRESTYRPHCTVEIHHRNKDGDHVDTMMMPMTNHHTVKGTILLNPYEEIHQLIIRPIDGIGIIQFNELTLVTKSNKTIIPSYHLQCDQLDNNTYLLKQENTKIKVNLGTYTFALKYLTFNLKVKSTSLTLIKLIKEFGNNTLYPTGQDISLPLNTQFPVNIKYAIDQLVVFQNRYLLVKGWLVSKSNDSELVVTVNNKNYKILLTYIREDIEILHPSESARPNAFWEVIDLEQPVKSTALQAILSIKSGEENLTFKKNISHREQPSSLSLDNQYAIQVNQWSLSSNPNKISTEITRDYTISIVTPVYNVDPKWLDLCIKSVLNQTYQHWQLCLYDDRSTNQETIDCLKKWDAVGDPRIRIGYGKENVNISGATNGAIALADGDYITFLDNDDELTPDAIYVVVQYLNAYPDTTILYSDEDKYEMTGHRTGPYFKSDFNLDLLRSNNYFTHLTVIRKDIGDKIEWLKLGYEGAQDHDLVLRVIDVVDHSTIRHIPEVLYHWRKIPTSTAGNYGAKDYAYQAGVRALEDHMERNGIYGRIEKGMWGGAYRMLREIHNPKKVSIIIPFKDHIHFLERLIPSIEDNTLYPSYEILLINNQSEKEETLDFLSTLSHDNTNIKVLDYDYPFNYAAMNNWAVTQADGDYIMLLNNDMEVITEGWLSNMVEHIQRDEVGAVGCKLLYEDNTLQHAGVLMGINGSAGHAFKGQTNGTHYFNMGVIKNVSGVTGACLLTKKELYLELGGLDEKLFKVAYNDVDYCLKLREKGFLIVYTPYTELYHYESKSRGYEDTPEKEARHLQEKEALQKKWGQQCLVDPYYNPNLSYKSQANALAIEVEDEK